FAEPKLPSGGTSTRLIEDREGNVWVGAATGLFRLRPARMKVYSSRDRLAGDLTLAVTQGPDGTIWVGTARGVSGIRIGRGENVAAQQGGLAKHGKAVLAADGKNALWAGAC